MPHCGFTDRPAKSGVTALKLTRRELLTATAFTIIGAATISGFTLPSFITPARADDAAPADLAFHHQPAFFRESGALRSVPLAKCGH